MTITQATNPNEFLGATLKSIRNKQGWSLDKTAAATGVSKAMLGQIERGESSPTIAILWKITTGMKISLSSLLAPDHQPHRNKEDLANQTTGNLPIFRSADEIRYQPAQDDMLVALLFPFDEALGFEIYELTLLPHYQRESEPHEAGVTEHVLLIHGNMEVLLNGDWKKLTPGESVKFNADQVHGYRNLHHQPAVFHLVIHYPNRHK